MTSRGVAAAAALGLLLLSGCSSEDDAGLKATGGAAGSSADASAGSAGSSAGSAGSAAGNAGQSGSGGSAGSTCSGTHALEDGGTRFCAPGECRCETDDRCYPRPLAEACCAGKLRCFSQTGATDCEGRHPEVDGGQRFCKNGDCYCEASDTCYSAATAGACCGSTPQCG